jgi:hypothetical protein
VTSSSKSERFVYPAVWTLSRLTYLGTRGASGRATRPPAWPGGANGSPSSAGQSAPPCTRADRMRETSVIRVALPERVRVSGSITARRLVARVRPGGPSGTAAQRRGPILPLRSARRSTKHPEREVARGSWAPHLLPLAVQARAEGRGAPTALLPGRRPCGQGAFRSPSRWANPHVSRIPPAPRPPSARTEGVCPESLFA